MNDEREKDLPEKNGSFWGYSTEHPIETWIWNILSIGGILAAIGAIGSIIYIFIASAIRYYWQ